MEMVETRQSAHFVSSGSSSRSSMMELAKDMEMPLAPLAPLFSISEVLCAKRSGGCKSMEFRAPLLRGSCVAVVCRLFCLRSRK